MPKRIIKWLHGKAESRYQKKYHGKYRHPKHLFALDIILIGGIVFLTGFILYFNFFWTPGILRQVELGFFAPSDWRIGAETKFEVRYANRSKETLGEAALAVELPRGFILESSSPDFSQYKVLHLGALPPGGNGQVELRGRALGNLGEKQELRAYLAFSRGAGREQKAAVAAINFSKPAMEVKFDFPRAIVAGEEIVKSAEVLNIAGLPGASLKISFNVPPDFILRGGNAERPQSRAERGGAETILEKPGERASILFDGYALLKAKEVKILIQSKLLFDGEEFLNDERIYSIAVAPPQISVSLSSGGSSFVSPGETVGLRFVSSNNSEKDAGNASIGIDDTNNILDKSFAPAGARWDGNILIFAVRESFSAGKELDAAFKVKIKDDFSAESGELAKNLKLNLAPFIFASKNNKRYYGNPLELKFLSELAVAAFARYFSPGGEPLGRGPLPPKVGKETRVWIFFEIKNTSNDVLGAKVLARLPAGVEFTGATTAFYGGEIKYDAPSRIASWEPGLVPAYAGRGEDAVAAAFEVKFTPAESDRGKTMLLLDNI
ncbi:MAG: hypothetical protein AAB731_05080, partial [Patescibacteria group bacterium]